MKRLMFHLLIFILVTAAWVSFSFRMMKRPERHTTKTKTAAVEHNFILIGPTDGEGIQKDVVTFPIQGAYGMTIIESHNPIVDWVESKSVAIEGITLYDMRIGVWTAFQLNDSQVKITHLGIQLNNRVVIRQLPNGFVIEAGKIYTAIVDEWERQDEWAGTRFRIDGPNQLYVSAIEADSR